MLRSCCSSWMTSTSTFSAGFRLRRPVHSGAMSAWQIHSLDANSDGNPARLSQIDVPRLQRPDEVLVQVRAASVNPIDVKMARGYGRAVLGASRRCTGDEHDLPMTLGRDFSGTVADVGHGVSDLNLGDDVWGVVGPDQRGGTHQEYIRVHRKAVSRKPERLSHVESAAIPYAAMTLWSALTVFACLKEHQPKRVLVLGGSGGLGHLAIQILKAWNCQVVTTCSGSAREFVSKFGPDQLINYTDEDYHEQLRNSKQFDLILDCAGVNDPGLMRHLRPWSGSKYVTLDSPVLVDTDARGLACGIVSSGLNLARKNVSSLVNNGSVFAWGYFTVVPGAMEKLAKMSNNGELIPAVEAVYPFSDLPLAYEKLHQGRSRGKTVIDFSPSSEPTSPAAPDS